MMVSIHPGCGWTAAGGTNAKAPLLAAMRDMLGGAPGGSALQVVSSVDADELAEPDAHAAHDRAVGRCVRDMMVEQIRVASELRKRRGCQH